MSWPATAGLGLVLTLPTAVGLTFIWGSLHLWMHDHGAGAFIGFGLLKGCVELVPVAILAPILFGKHPGNVAVVVALVALVGGNLWLGRIARRVPSPATAEPAFESPGDPEQ